MFFAAGQVLGCAVCMSSSCLFSFHLLSGTRVPQPMARHRSRGATHTFTPESRHRFHFHHQPYWLGSVRASAMKSTILIFAIISLTITLVACNRENKDVLPQESGVVIFPNAGVSIDAGAGWKRIELSPGLPVCPPTLVGSAGMVRAMLFARGITDPQAATNAVRSMFDGDSDAVKDSYHQEDFTTDSGLKGWQISYSVRSDKNGSVTEARSHSYVVQRKDGRCVAISYLTTAKTDSDAVRQMIQKSLRLQ